jgi:hypothetical protein
MMIELTQEQWQAITREATSTVIEPESKAEYVVVPKNRFDQLQSGEAEAARVLRIAWMRRMRLDEDEITESLCDEPPTSVEDEMKQIRAIENLDRITPAGDILRQYAIRY